MINKMLKKYRCKYSKICGVKALPIIKPIRIRAGAEKSFGL
jgi:hypothetical protein